MTQPPIPSTDVRTDGEVVAAVLAGDTESFGVLVERYRVELGRVAEAILGDFDTAADALQDAFISAYQSLGRCRDPERFKAWLYQIVRNRCRDVLRRRPPVAIDSVDVPARDTADGPLAEAELGRMLEQAMTALTLEQKEAFVLKEIEGRSYQEMTELLDTRVDALRMRVMRAKDVLRKALGGAP
jgi:RNA polymerase sigma-70 factor, ECF subfamily